MSMYVYICIYLLCKYVCICMNPCKIPNLQFSSIAISVWDFHCQIAIPLSFDLWTWLFREIIIYVLVVTYAQLENALEKASEYFAHGWLHYISSQYLLKGFIFLKWICQVDRSRNVIMDLSSWNYLHSLGFRPQAQFFDCRQKCVPVSITKR